MNSPTENMNATKPRMASLFASAGAMLGACAGICGSACFGSLALPLLGFLGLSSSALHFFERLKPLFLLITVVCLAYAFHKAYKPRPAVSSDVNCCDTSKSCCPPKKKTFIQSKSFLWGITLLCAIMWLYPYAANILSNQRSCSVPCNSQSR